MGGKMERTLYKIHFNKEKETLLITLHAKALDYRSKNSILHDEKAGEILELIDYDFEKFNGPDHDNLTVVRAKQFDAWLQEFLDKNHNGVVLNLGCGLDTRVTRINPTKSVEWFDVDYLEVINLRKNFYANLDNYTMVASSVTEPNWLTEIPNNKPVMVVAEGLLEYLTEAEVKMLLNRLSNHFSNGQIAFDVISSFALKAGRSALKKATGAEHQWSADNPSEVDKLDNQLERITDLPLLKSRYINQLPWVFRLIYGVMSIVPPFRTMIRMFRYQFKNSPPS
jgi:O-methyltransferase involved in polyketide biosynthesis